MPESSKEPIFEPPFNPDKKQELSESAQAIQNDLSDLLLELKNMRGLVGSDGKLILAAELWQKVLGFFWKDDSENSLTRAENFRANVRAIGERLETRGTTTNSRMDGKAEHGVKNFHEPRTRTPSNQRPQCAG